MQGDTIIVRREALRQWLWQKAEGWGVKRQPGAMRQALAAYAFDNDPAAAIERMLDAETETVTLHETGEWLAGRILGPAWHERMAAMTHRHAELLLRAVRDLLADHLVTLPTLLERRAWPSLHLWFASLDGLRRALAPTLVAAYDADSNYSRGDTAHGASDTDIATLAAAVAAGASHWQQAAMRLLREDDDALAALVADPQPLAV